jgi:hypothetical protein
MDAIRSFVGQVPVKWLARVVNARSVFARYRSATPQVSCRATAGAPCVGDLVARRRTPRQRTHTANVVSLRAVAASRSGLRRPRFYGFDFNPLSSRERLDRHAGRQRPCIEQDAAGLVLSKFSVADAHTAYADSLGKLGLIQSRLLSRDSQQGPGRNNQSARLLSGAMRRSHELNYRAYVPNLATNRLTGIAQVIHTVNNTLRIPSSLHRLSRGVGLITCKVQNLR